MLVGYARVSTIEQTLDLQQDALNKAGCTKIYTDIISGAKWAGQERVGLSGALEFMRRGDTLVVWRLDRLGRSLKHLIETVTTLKEQGISFKSLTEHIDTSTATGTLVFQIFGALAEFERNLMKERTVAGLNAARARGRTGGRPTGSPDERKVALARKFYHDHALSIPDILKTLNISKSTLYRWVDIAEGETKKA